MKLSDYGAGNSLSPSSFPDCVDPEYFEAWIAYVETQTAQDLFNMSNHKDMGMIFAVQGFLSSLNSFTTQATIRPVPPVGKTSLERFKKLLRWRNRAFQEFLKQKLFRKKFRLAEVKSKITPTYNRVANCILYTGDIYLTFVPQDVKQSVGEILHTNKQFWFSGKTPVSLFKSDNLTKLLEKSAMKNLPDTYPSLVTIMGKPKLWHEWNSELGLDCARTKGNSISLRIRLEKQIFFLGKHKQSEIERLINRTISQVFI